MRPNSGTVEPEWSEGSVILIDGVRADKMCDGRWLMAGPDGSAVGYRAAAISALWAAGRVTVLRGDHA